MRLRRVFSYMITLVCAIIILIAIPNQIDSSAQFLRQILIPKDGQILRALFTPQDDIRQTIVSLINNEQKAIQIAIYFFTDVTIANALIHAKRKKEIDISIIVDPAHATKCPHTQIYRLRKAGIPVHVFEILSKDGIFHHKFMRFERNLDDKTFLLTGSFNLTRTAQEYNWENVIITDNFDISDKYYKQFNYLKTKSQTLDQFIKKQRIK
jgi:phosphatidylserine/phosphatidylglycerophosphate/cardiolipin synthase-like enzyme